jgi:membrane-bound metal-dependent hydrolase YbcI (DUF457 family)
MFPDFVDKTFLFLNLTNGRWYFHSLLFVFLSFLILYLVSRGNKPISFPFLIGMVFHLILDLPDVPIFYPFISYEYKRVDDPISHWVATLLTDPVVQITEITGAMVLIFIGIHNKINNLEELKKFLKVSPKFPETYQTNPKSAIKSVDD